MLLLLICIIGVCFYEFLSFCFLFFLLFHWHLNNFKLSCQWQTMHLCCQMEIKFYLPQFQYLFFNASLSFKQSNIFNFLFWGSCCCCCCSCFCCSKLVSYSSISCSTAGAPCCFSSRSLSEASLKTTVLYFFGQEKYACWSCWCCCCYCCCWCCYYCCFMVVMYCISCLFYFVTWW